MNRANQTVKCRTLRLLLVTILAVALLGVVQLGVSHIHVFDHGVECDLHASGSNLNAAVSHAIDWFLLFALAPLLVIVLVSPSVPTFPRFLSRAPPVFHH